MPVASASVVVVDAVGSASPPGGVNFTLRATSPLPSCAWLVLDAQRWLTSGCTTAGANATIACVCEQGSIFALVHVEPAPSPQLHSEQCQSVGDFVIWGGAARGLDLRNYTGNSLMFLGASAENNATSRFTCSYNSSSDTLSFGVSR
jgi:hypothetical protein